MLVTGREILNHAHENGYAVGAFNVNNMEQVQAIIEAAEETKSPVIIQASQGGLQYAGVEYIAGMAKIAAKKATQTPRIKIVPILSPPLFATLNM